MSHTSTNREVHPLQDVRFVIIAGTFVHRWFRLLYWPLQRFIEAQGYAVDVLCIPKLGLGDLDAANDALALEIFVKHPESRFILIGHSQGGLHTLLLAHCFVDRVLTVINFGAPHHGTLLTNLVPWVPKLPAVRAMAAHSPRLRTMRAAEAFPPDRIHSYYTIFDQLVLPWFSPAYKGAHNVLVAPRILHGVLKQLGQRRSKGVELVHGVSDHIFVIWLNVLYGHIAALLDELEAPPALAA